MVYISQADIDEFRSTGSTQAEGWAYEWEGEGVVHLHLHPLRHAFGKVSRCLFSCEETASDGWQIVVGKEVKARNNNEEAEVQFIPAKEELYSRSKGLLEVNVLEKKHVSIIGLGSFGSHIAIELAKAGVGEFSLFDFDRVELHNLARHTCTAQELGRLKTDALTDAILGKNPYAKVNRYPIDINNERELTRQVVAESDIVICATDNNRSRFLLSELCKELQKVCIFGRAITRAEGGDVFIYRPGGACYCCLVGNLWYGKAMEEITDEQSARQSGVIPAYMSAEDAGAIVQVGLSADVIPICNMMVKLALMELSRGEESGISCLESELTANYYMWANRRERRHANWHAFPTAANAPTIMRWYGANVKPNPCCAVCSEEMELDLGEDLEEFIGKN